MLVATPALADDSTDPGGFYVGVSGGYAWSTADVTTSTVYDAAGYFDVSTDMASHIRRHMVRALASFGIEVEALHHEVAVGQHEIDFRYADALTCADNLTTFRWVVKTIAARNNMHATFMAKPWTDQAGNGMCETGECGGFLCPKAFGFPASATAFDLEGGFQGGYNVGLHVEGGSCGDHECTANLDDCDDASVIENACGRTIACSDICSASPACCARPGCVSCWTNRSR